MTKIKLLAGDDGHALEAIVNNFIADKNVIDIKYQANIYNSQFYSNGTPKNVEVNDRILVIYED